MSATADYADAFKDALNATDGSSTLMAIAMLRYALAAHEEELASGLVDAERQEELRVHIASKQLTLRRLEKEGARARARFLN